MIRPTEAEAQALLEWANAQNPGPWREHSRGVARAARLIAEAVGIDAQKAYLCGLLHDIGRYEGPRGMHHIIVGYDLLKSRGWDEQARVCITHSFPDHRYESYIGAADVSAEEAVRIKALLDAPFDDYDRLIQLGDAVSWGEGVCLMEKRLVSVVMRYDMNPYLKEKWQSLFDIKKDFETRMGKGLYSLFPECAENTLGM